MHELVCIDLETIIREGMVDEPCWQSFRDRKGLEDKDAALYAEFGQVAVIVVMRLDDDFNGVVEPLAYVSQNLEDERDVLQTLYPVLNRGNTVLCGHAIKMFDIPFLAKRYCAHGLNVPLALQVAGRKPWEIMHQDSMEIARFAGAAGMSLESLCLLLGIPTPKSKMHGCDVAKAIQNGEWAEVAEYGKGDVVATAGCLGKLYQCGAFYFPPSR